MKDLIQEYKELKASAEDVLFDIGELLKPVIRIFNSNPADPKYIEGEEVVSITFLEVRDSDFMAAWKCETQYDFDSNSSYNVIPFSIFDSENYIENAKNLIKSRERDEDVKTLSALKDRLEYSKSQIAILEEKLKNNI